MKESYWGYWLIMLGIFIIVVMIFTQDATTTTTQDYYQLKEVANSALLDSVDYSYFDQTQTVRIMKEVFVENFIRRFAETASNTNTYQIDFFDIYESPPKASIKISTTTGNYMIANTSNNADVVNSIDLIIEYTDSLHHQKDVPYAYGDCIYYNS